MSIVLRLAGGLGNQLFQVAAAISLAKRLEMPFSKILIDTRFLATYEAQHVYEAGFLAEFFSGIRVAQDIPFMESMASRFRLARVLDMKIGSHNLISSVGHLTSVFERHMTNTNFILDGYFQHPDILFTEHERNRIQKGIISSNSSLIDQVAKGSNMIGVHIRRGDYVTSKNASKVFRNIPITYYDAALNQLRPYQRVLVFSDDRELSYNYAEKIGATDVRRLNLTLQEEFFLLMACKDHIIANSTFSWWGAYLGHKADGRIIAPKVWYHDNLRNHNNPLLLHNFELIDE
jgi:hypothetical protein